MWQGYLVDELKILERQSAESSCLWRRSRWVGQKMEQYSLDPSFGYYEAAMVVLKTSLLLLQFLLLEGS